MTGCPRATVASWQRRSPSSFTASTYHTIDNTTYNGIAHTQCITANERNGPSLFTARIYVPIHTITWRWHTSSVSQPADNCCQPGYPSCRSMDWNDLRDDATSAILLSTSCHHHHHFWQAPLRVRSAECRHQSPEWTVLSQVHCIIHVEVAGFQILLNGFHPCNTRTSQWSPPVSCGGSC